MKYQPDLNYTRPFILGTGDMIHGWAMLSNDRNGRLQYIAIGTRAGWGDRYAIEYQYDSFGNIKRAGDWDTVTSSESTFSYDVQNRLTNGYGRTYSYDSAGRLTNYEGTTLTAGALRAHMSLPNSNYSFDNNGNLTSRYGYTLEWDHENHFSRLKFGTTDIEVYLYDAAPSGLPQRVRKTGGGVHTFYINPFYEVSGATVTKYHYFNGQRVSMHTNAPGGWVHYDLHGDHLGSTVFMTNQGGSPHSNEGYYAYGRNRTGGIGLTDFKFTGQKRDGTGLYYFNARYYDPDLGQFISPDTLVPDPSNLFDYNRYLYTRGNPLRYNDPTGHYSADELIQHFGCENWQCVEWQFDGQNYDSAYRGNGAWLQVLLNAVDGDKVTAWNPVQNQTMSGQFLRNADTGQIGIQMLTGDGQWTGAIPESSFANYGAVNPYAGGQRYALQSAKYSQHVGQLYHLPGMCGIWDCTALGYDVASLGLSAAGDAAIIATAATFGVSGMGVGAAKTADSLVTLASVVHTYDLVQQGKANAWDVRVQGITAGMSVTPGWGEVGGIIQLVWDVADPFHP